MRFLNYGYTEYLRRTLKLLESNISAAAAIFGIKRPVAYDIIKKEKEGDLRDRAKVAKHQPRRTPMAIEDRVIEVKNRASLGPERLSRHLNKHEGIPIPAGTVRHIVRRNKKRIDYQLRSHRVREEKRKSIDWYSAKPFEIVQIDLKYIRGHKALTKEEIVQLDRYDLPGYQWSVLDVSSRFKPIAHSREKSWTNGPCWCLWVISWLRSDGVESTTVFRVDNGEELGSKSWMKVRKLRKLISAFGCRVIQNHKGHCEENAHLERSHWSDDDGSYIPRALEIKSQAGLLNEATGCAYYYNNVRGRSSLDYQAPFCYLKSHLPGVDAKTRFVIPIMLDKVSVGLGPWSGYNVLAQHLISTIAIVLVKPTGRKLRYGCSP